MLNQKNQELKKKLLIKQKMMSQKILLPSMNRKEKGKGS